MFVDKFLLFFSLNTIMEICWKVKTCNNSFLFFLNEIVMNFNLRKRFKTIHEFQQNPLNASFMVQFRQSASFVVVTITFFSIKLS